ncbi:MAG: oligosaccharide flippase family protein [Eubacteriales bacterium]|nr:oligosaccharide flippase family protein [Eubacteriales bacterium]
MKNRIAKNYIYNLIYNALNIIVPMITVPYVTRIILPAQMGMFSTAQSIFTIVTIAAQFGVLIYGTRSIAMAHEDKMVMLDRFRHIFSTQVFTTVLFLIPSIILPLLITGMSEVGWIYAVNAFLILNATVDICWFYNGQEEFRITITRNIFVKIIAVALIFILVKSKDDIIIYSLIYIVAAFLGNLSMFFNLKKFAGTYRIFSIKWIDKEVIKEAVPFMIPLLLAMVFVETGRFFVYGIAGEAVTGIYDQALKVARMLIILTAALVSVASPRMSKCVGSKSYDKMREYFAKIFSVLLFQTLLVASGIIAVGNDFVSFFFGTEYAGVAPVLRVLSVYPIVFMLEQSVLVLLLRPLGRTKTMLTAILISLGLNILLNILLVPSMGAIGAVLALIVSTIVNSAIQALSCREFILWRPILKNAMIIAFSAALTTVLLLFAKSQFSFGAPANFIIYGSVCIALYSGIILLIGKDIRGYALQYTRSIVNRIKNKRKADYKND